MCQCLGHIVTKHVNFNSVCNKVQNKKARLLHDEHKIKYFYFSQIEGHKSNRLEHFVVIILSKLGKGLVDNKLLFSVSLAFYSDLLQLCAMLHTSVSKTSMYALYFKHANDIAVLCKL